MGRERQKKKNRSSVHKATLKPHGRTKTGKRKVNFLGDPIIAKNWDPKLTVTQNYKLLGLSSRLNAPTGGSEKKPKQNEREENHPTTGAFSMPTNRKTTKLVPTETKVERDPHTGHIIRLVRADGGAEDDITRRMKLNPLNDPLEDLADDEVASATSTRPTGVVAELKAQAEAEAAILNRTRRPRQQSQREEEWIARLVKKYGDNTKAMARDVKLNPMQQSEGDLRRRLKKWKEKR